MQKERVAYILEKLDQKGRLLVSELSRELHVSEMTIRLDLRLLSDQGLVRRVHGGAERAGESLYKGDIRQNLYRNAAAKLAIAKAAVRQIHPGDALLVDDSSTCLYLLRQIKKDPSLGVTVYTNSILAAAELLDTPHIHLFLIGGECSRNLAATSGPAAEQELAAIRADHCIIGANGVSPEAGVSVIGYSQMKIKQAMLTASRHHILLADSHKFNLQFLSVVCPLSDIDLLITDSDSSEELLAPYLKQTAVLRA